MLSKKQRVLLESFGLMDWANEARSSKVFLVLNWIRKHNPNGRQIEELKKKLGI